MQENKEREQRKLNDTIYSVDSARINTAKSYFSSFQ